VQPEIRSQERNYAFGIFPGISFDWGFWNEQFEDHCDSKIAKARLREIATGPEQLVTGAELDAQLEKLLL
jgi:hypothetical protein